MRVWGRQKNRAVMKIPQGSSGPRTNPFQKISIGAGTIADADTLAGETGGSRRVHSSHPIAARATAKAKLRARAVRFVLAAGSLGLRLAGERARPPAPCGGAALPRRSCE